MHTAAVHSFIRPFTNINSLQIFQILQFGTAILIGVLLVKLGLPKASVTIYEALLFIASLYCFFWIVGGQNTLLQLFPTLDKNAQARAIFNMYGLFTLLGLVTAAALYVSRPFINQYLTSFGDLPYLDLLALFLVFNCPTFLIQYYYLLLEKYREIVVYGCVVFSLQLLVVVVPIYLDYSLEISIKGLIGWAALKYLWGLGLVIRQGQWTYDLSYFKAFFPLFGPLLLFALIGKGTEYISGLLVSSLFTDEDAFAIFRYGAREFPIAVLLVGALATSLIPEMAKDKKQGLIEIREKTYRIAKWLYPLSIVSMLLSPFIFPMAFSPDFKESAYIFNIFTLLLASRIVLPQVVAIGHQHNGILTVSALVEMLVLLALSWWWGTEFGLRGIAYAAVVSFMVDRIILIYYNWKVLGIPPAEYIYIRAYIIQNLLLLAGFFLSLSI